VSWPIVFYTTADKKSPVQEFIDGLPKKQQGKVLRGISLLREHGTALREPQAKPLGDGLWELRTTFGGDAFRLLYFTWTASRFVILHGFQKKTQQTPEAELETARRRRRDWLQRHQEGE
jgi:phage-related protein